jgi:hypothetical protein
MCRCIKEEIVVLYMGVFTMEAKFHDKRLLDQEWLVQCMFQMSMEEYIDLCKIVVDWHFLNDINLVWFFSMVHLHLYIVYKLVGRTPKLVAYR